MWHFIAIFEITGSDVVQLIKKIVGVFIALFNFWGKQMQNIIHDIKKIN